MSLSNVPRDDRYVHPILDPTIILTDEGFPSFLSLANTIPLLERFGDWFTKPLRRSKYPFRSRALASRLRQCAKTFPRRAS